MLAMAGRLGALMAKPEMKWYLFTGYQDRLKSPGFATLGLTAHNVPQ
jgi:hypothetical protein